MSSGSPPERHPEHPKIPSAALKPLHARSFAPVDRNRPPGTSCRASAPEPPITFLQLCKDTVPNTVLPCLPARRTPRGRRIRDGLRPLPPTPGKTILRTTFLDPRLVEHSLAPRGAHCGSHGAPSPVPERRGACGLQRIAHFPAEPRWPHYLIFDPSPLRPKSADPGGVSACGGVVRRGN